MKIINLIRNTRKVMQLSQSDFGKLFGASHAAVSDWEKGKSEASYKVVEFCFEYILNKTVIS